MSLTVVGCGAVSSTTKVTDAGKKDAITPVADTGSTPDVINPAGPEAGPDTRVLTVPPDAAVDVNNVTGPEVGTTPDGGADAQDSGSVSGPDGPKLDAPKLDAIDAPSPKL